MIEFSKFDLIPAILKSLKKIGYQHATPIQEKSIPPLLEGKDLLGIAQTGTGKTAAFLLPIINKLATDKKTILKNKTRVLILTPTRELASQILANIKEYSEGLNLKSAVIFGGVGHRPQIRSMASGLDFLVATPGRLLDLMNDGYIKYDALEFFVLDEADRMLDMGFIHDIKKIIAKLPTKKQTLLFSATMPKDIAVLAKSLLKNPITVEVTPQATTVEKISQQLYHIVKKHKPKLLKHLITNEGIDSVLVFTRTKHGANKVVKYLDKEGIVSAAIHGNKSQNAREKALSDFKKGTIKVLIATDIAARGIDVDSLSHVINFDLPEDFESYVHRIGRTARAGKEGTAISFCDDAEVKLLNGIERLIKYKIPKYPSPAFKDDPNEPVASKTDRNERTQGSNRSSKSPRSKRSFKPKASVGANQKKTKRRPSKPSSKTK